MKENPEDVKYVLVKRRPSAWRRGAIPAAVVAAIQVFFTIQNGRDIGTILFGAVVIFVAYWVFFTVLVWLWRVITRSA